MDADTADSTFQDWADELGYDSDSIKALSTYQACCEIAQQLRRLIPDSKTRRVLAALSQSL
jgi:hypothetical protein